MRDLTVLLAQALEAGMTVVDIAHSQGSPAGPSTRS